ncbi:Sister chromatid cohesion protein pds5 [Rhodotorula kratochvilovae]
MPARHRLDFPHPLKGASSTSELVKRLKHAHDQLRDFDQDLVDTSSLDQLAAQLRQPNLLLHKDKGVKAYAACCLVDVLRLYAPEAPYTPAQLKDIFDFLIRQFRFVGAPNDPHQAEYFFVVDSLASVKSIVLICDLDAADDLIERVFRESFDTISTTSPKNVELALCDILLALLEEVPNVPTSVTDILTAQFLPRAVKQRPAAHRLATEVCRGASDKLQRYVSQYFGETIVAAMNGGSGARGAASSDEESEEEEDDDEDSDDGTGGAKKRRGRKAKTKAKGKLKETNGGASGSKSGDKDSDLPPALVEAHDLIRSLNRHVPALLLNVIPQLAEELTTSSPSYRRLATGALGAMFGEPLGRGDLARAFPAVWRAWLARARDRDAGVRARMCECLRRIWREHPELAADVAQVLVGALLEDREEKVRVAACAVFEEMDYETAAHHVPRRVLEAVGGRVVDKKEKVRTVACKVLGRLYDLAFPEIETRDDHTLKQFGWIPGVLLDSLKATDSSGAASAAHQHLINSTLLSSILPQPKSDKDAGEPDVLAAWVDRFLLVERALATDEQRRALLALTRLADKRGGSVWEGYIGACESYNSGIVDDKKQAEAIKDFLKRAIRTIASNMPDPAKASEDLMTFAQQNVAQLYRELRALLDPQTDLRAHLKNARDLLRRVEKFPHGESCAATFDAFIRMASYPLLNRSSVPQLLRRLTATTGEDARDWAASAARVLEYVCKMRAGLFKAHAAELAKLLSECAPATEPAERGTVAALVLHALARLKRAEEGVAIDAKLSKKAVLFARESKDEREAKHAATLLALDKGRPGALDDLVEFLVDEIPTASDATLVAHLGALARIALYGQPAFERRAEALIASSLEVLTRAGGEGEALKPEEDDDDEGATWTDACDPLTRARVLAVKVVANRCLAYKGSDEAQKVQKEAFTVLWPLLAQHGGNDGTTPPVASRVRLAVALAIIKLFASQDKHYVQAILPRLDVLARTAQDATYEVREAFLKKLVAYLRQNRFLPAAVPRLNMVLFLVAHEPEEELKAHVLAFAKSRRRMPDTQRQQQWELPFLRLLHLLAHHPDFDGADTSDVEILKSIAKYIEEYLEIFATAENLSFFYHLALSAKSVRDRHAPDSENLYILSDISQHLLKLLAARHAWPISTYPGHAQLPADLFTKFASADDARKVAKREFVPAETLKEIGALKGEKKERKKVVARKRASPAAGAAAPKPKRARTSKAASTPRGGKKKADKWDSDAESSAAEESSAEEDESEEEAEKPVKGKGKGKGAKKARSAPRGSRGGLRSDPGKSLKKGLGEEEKEETSGDDDDDARSVTAEQEDEGDEEMEVDAAPAETEVSEDEEDKPVRGRGAKAKASPAKKKAPAAAKGKKAAPAAVNGKSPAKGKKKGAAAAAALPDKNAGTRRALRGLAQPRALKKADVEAVSDVGDTEDEEEGMSE